MVVLIIGCTFCICCYRLSKRPRIPVKQEKLCEDAKMLERDAMQMANELPEDPGKMKVKESLIAHNKQEASRLRNQAAKLPDDNARRCKEFRDQAGTRTI